MKGSLLVLAAAISLFLLVAGCCCAFTPTKDTTQPTKPTIENPPVNTGNEYDGTYDWYLGDVHGIVSHCSSCVYIQDGQVSNSDGSFSNTNIDNFGNIVFNGPCPNGNPFPGTFTGKIGGHNPPQWQGTWSCSDGSQGGTKSTWKIFNGK